MALTEQYTTNWNHHINHNFEPLHLRRLTPKALAGLKSAHKNNSCIKKHTETVTYENHKAQRGFLFSNQIQEHDKTDICDEVSFTKWYSNCET